MPSGARSPVLRILPNAHDEVSAAWLAERLRDAWGSPEVVSRGRIRDASRLPAVLGREGDEVVGLATFEVVGDACELVTLDAFREGRGVGTALLEAVIEEARARACKRVWLITTNDNLRALRFYQRRGLRLVAVHPGALDEARRLKPEIPRIGLHGIALRDEIELELEL
jgi:ribosomal protein S18 acetylase RimI-like enzyme